MKKETWDSISGLNVGVPTPIFFFQNDYCQPASCLTATDGSFHGGKAVGECI